MTSIFDQHLPRTEANFAALSPLSFIERTAEVYPDRLAIVHGTLRQTWAQTYARCRQLASALTQAGIGKNDTVAVMLPNTPPMVEAHFGVPMAGAVLNTLNTRLDPEAIAFMLDHGEAKAVIVDPEFIGTMAKALALRTGTTPIRVIEVQDALYGPAVQSLGGTDYEAFVASGDAAFAWSLPADEWDAIALNYTSGTTGNPKGVVYHHRGAATNAISNVLEWDMPKHAVYLWTLPMFHCNGWCFPWTVAMLGGTHVCLRRVEAKLRREAAAMGQTLEGADLRVAVAGELGVSLAEVAMMEGRLAGSDASLNATQAADEDGREWIDVLEDDGAQAAELFETKHDADALSAQLNRALGVLNDRERLIVRARQLAEEPRTLESLGQELRLSKERIRQLEAAAYTKLRRTLEAEGANFAQFVG